MKIVVFSHAGGSPHHGPNMRWYYLGRVLSANGYDIRIVSASWFHKYFSPPEMSQSLGLHKRSVHDGILYYWIKTPKYNRKITQVINQIIYTLLSTLFAVFSKELKSADLVIASSPPPFSIFPAKVLAKLSDSPLIFETRDLWPLVIKDLSGKSKHHPYLAILGWCEKFAISNSTRVVSVKPGDYEYFYSKYGLSRDRFSYVPNGFWPEADLPKNVDLSHFDLPSDKIIVGYVGAMSCYYGLQDLLRSAEELAYRDDICFCLVGTGEDHEQLKKTSHDYGLDNVFFLGSVERNLIPDLLSRFDICYVGLKDVSANLNGISCNKIFEYMCAGKPVLASYRTKYDPVMFGECGVTVPPSSPAQISKTILELADDPKSRDQLGQNGYHYFREHHDFKKVALKYEAIFKDITEAN